MNESNGKTHGVPPIWKLTDPTQIPTGAEAEEWMSRLRACAAPREDLGYLTKHLPEYDIVRRLDDGGQGIVYMAFQRVAKRYVAIKVLRDGPFATESQRRRLMREVEIVGRLTHPNIVTLYGAGEVQGNPYLVMEYVDGTPIDDYVLLEDLSVDEIVKLFVSVCRAVAFAQQNGVIHRDLKPANILVDEEGNPRVLDFGLAREVDSKSSLSACGAMVGTLAYQSPEQAGGRTAEVDARSDIYALGVILFELITDRHPHDISGNAAQTRTNITTRDPIRPRKIRAISDDLEKVILKALARDQAQRYHSAASFADDLDRYLAGEAVHAKSQSEFYILAKSLRRFRVPIAIGAAFAAVAIAALMMVWAERVRTDALAHLASQGLKTAGLVKLGTARADEGSVDEAFAVLETALTLSGSVSDADAVVMRYRFDAMRQIAELHFDEGNPGKGESYARRAAALVSKMIEKDGNVPEWIRLRGFVCRLLGRAALGRADWSGAFAAFDEGVSIRSDLMERSPGNSSLRSELATMLALRGKSLRKLGLRTDAMADLTAAHDHFTELTTVDPGDVNHELELSRMETRMAVLLMETDTAETDSEARRFLNAAATRLTRLKDAGRVRVRHVDDLLESIGDTQDIIRARSKWRSRTRAKQISRCRPGDPVGVAVGLVLPLGRRT